MTTLQEVELGALGPLQVRQYGLPVTIPGAKPRAILTMLGLHGGSVVSADTLLELLWGNEPPRTAAKALQTHISALRRTLGDGFVLTQGTGWTLSTTTEIDAIRYKTAEKLGRDAAAGGDSSQAVARFDEALALWRGVPELPDTARGISERTRWVEGHAALVEDRADALLATGRAAEIIGELEAAVGDAPLRERRWGQLMLALYRAGRQGEALGAYQRARTLLANELGVDPGPDLRRLEAAIVAQDESLEIPVSQHLSTVTRAVTFLLTDIEGSTAAWEADADAMAVALARHDEIVEQVVTSRGGRLVKTRGEGDATFSVFDRPSAAAAAAIELQEAIRHEPWALTKPMRIRIALHTGEVELRDGDYFGRAVNRAARLRSLAEGGQILCSGATAELVIDTLRDDVVLADLGMRQLKNLARPEHVFELRLESADDSVGLTDDEPAMPRPGLPAVLAGTGPFVGRRDELGRLLVSWQATLGGGTGAVLISGEPGVGKTRLAGEWSRQAYEQGAIVVYGRCDEDLGAPYQPFAESLRALVPCLGSKRLRGLRGVEALLPLVPGLHEELPDLAAPARADADTERYALFDAVVALLGVASATAPILLILDDLHWAAKPTLLLLRHLLRFGEHARVQIVGTYRSTDLDRSHPLAAMLADLHRDGSAHRLALSGLDEDDVTAYVAEAGYDDEELARALASVTGGNPFFLIEALRHVDESGGRWDPSTLPQGVREAVSRRLSRLPMETNKALAAAAVVGSRFALDLVERVTEQDLVDAFDEASKAGIVIEEPGGYYRFNHALVRQSLLAELASVRRMRLHQRIATILETESGADNELLAELAYHYFECAWAGNAVKAVEYCRRAADQAMARLAYEGAADYYDRALHALDELDDELPDRDDVQAELLVARCEALLAAGDVVSARGAVSQLQSAAGDSARLAAWGTCFDAELSMLTDPERLDEIEVATAEAAVKLAALDDAAGEAKAHTVRATCLGRLGRIGDCETALDQALTAARRAREHRRVNNVLANAPLAALWGPNPVPRAGGRCLDVVRLLRITTGSPVVEATSTRCQGVLDAFRGRAAAGRQLIESARRSLSELGMRHALLEVEQFAGIVELVAGDPAAAEPHLRRACNGFRRMGLDADTAETAALLARACLALDRDDEADELCAESERLAGHALKAAIAWRTVRAQLLARRGEHDEARRVAEGAVALAARTDALVDHGDACLALATVLRMAGDNAAARTAAEQAVELYERKGAAALAESARKLLGDGDVPTAAAVPDIAVVEFDTPCVRAGERVAAAINRAAWDELDQMFSPTMSIESRRKLVGFTQDDLSPGNWAEQLKSGLAKSGTRMTQHVITVRGDHLALARVVIGNADTSPGAPMEDFLWIFGVDEQGCITLEVWFDTADEDAAIAELDALHERFEAKRGVASSAELENACVRAIRRLDTAYDREDWEEIKQLVAPVITADSHRKVVGLGLGEIPYREWEAEAKRFREILGPVRYDHVVVTVRGERLALTRLVVGTADATPGAPRDDWLQLYGIDESGRIALLVWFDGEDMDAAIAELDARHAQFEGRRRGTEFENAASRSAERFGAYFLRRDWDTLRELLSENFFIDDRRRTVNAGLRIGVDTGIKDLQAVHDVGFTGAYSAVIATRGERLALTRGEYFTGDEHSGAFHTTVLHCNEIDADGRLVSIVVFETDDIDAAFAELDTRYVAGEASPYADTWSVVADGYAALNRREIPALSPNWVNIDHRRVTAFAPGDQAHFIRASWQDTPDIRIRIAGVHRLSVVGAVVTSVSRGTSRDGFDAEWTSVELLTVDNAAFSRCELFDARDLDAALARFDELAIPATPLDNAAGRTEHRTNSLFAEGRWDDIAELLAENVRVEERRTGIQRESKHRATLMDEIRVIAELGVRRITSEVLAIRGEHLVLSRVRFEGRDQRPDAFHTELLRSIELGADGRIVAVTTFDSDNIDAAIAELDTRYAHFVGQGHRNLLDSAASRVHQQLNTLFAEHRWEQVAELFAENVRLDDRRRGLRRQSDGRESTMTEVRAIAELGVKNIIAETIAVRGARLVLSRTRFVGRDPSPSAFHAELLRIVEIDSDERIVTVIDYDLDNFFAALAEFDSRYLADEGAEHAETWRKVVQAYATLQQRKLPPTTPDWINVDHRRLAPVEAGNLAAFVHDAQRHSGDIYVEAVYRLGDDTAVVGRAVDVLSQDGFEAEWREIDLLTFEGDRISRLELFDQADLENAVATFDGLTWSAPQLENAASRVSDRLQASFAARDWTAMAVMLADDLRGFDRRKMINLEASGRESVTESYRAASEFGVRTTESTVLAIRGDRLVLHRLQYTANEHQSDAFQVELLQILEIDADETIVQIATFDIDDVDGAFKELDAWYLAGEAATYVTTWSLLMAAYDDLNRHHLPATAPDWINVDHRRTTSFAPGETFAYLGVTWNLLPDYRMRITAVHRLGSLGAVIGHSAHGRSAEGFDAEWRLVALFTFDGDLINRCEIYDERDLDAALARFDELSRPTSKLENAAIHVFERYMARFVDRDWDAMAGMLADDFVTDDRRRVVNAGLRHGRDAEIANMKSFAGIGISRIASSPVATRGQRLFLGLHHVTISDSVEPSGDVIGIIEINTENRLSAHIMFDAEDIDAALEELDKRYVVGEAAAHANAWSVIARASAAVSQREVPPPTMSLVSIDHRRGVKFGPGELTDYLRAGAELGQEIRTYPQVVHRLTNDGAVVTSATTGASQSGFDAEWRNVTMAMVDGELISRLELFDEADLDAALARFDELSRPTPRLENLATRMYDHFNASLVNRDFDAMTEVIAEDVVTDDRRRVVSGGIQLGRDAQLASMRAVVEVGVRSVQRVVVATRGERLALIRSRVSGGGEQTQAFGLELLIVLEVDRDGQVSRGVLFDLDDIEDAYTELETRYLAGEAAPHADVWSAVAASHAAIGRGEMPVSRPDWAFVDHRRGSPLTHADLTEIIKTSRGVTPDLRSHIEAVHRLTGRGAVVTQTSSGTSPEGFEAEWRMVNLVTVDDGQLCRCELYDEADLDAALARYEELTVRTPPLENAASHVYERFKKYYSARNWSAAAELLGDDVCSEDRRRVVNAGCTRGRDAVIAEIAAISDVGVTNIRSEVIATRGTRLVLSKVRVSEGAQEPGPFTAEAVDIIELDASHHVVGRVVFDLDDIDAAFAELDARYVTDEGAPHARTWAVITNILVAHNNREVAPATQDAASVDHRRGAGFAPGQGLEYVVAGWEAGQTLNIYIEAVHRISDVGAVFTFTAQGRSSEGFDAEWRGLELMMVENDMLSRAEVFDESDIDAALARFDELNRQTPQIENAATRTWDELIDAFNRRDTHKFLELTSPTGSYEDRRQGLRDSQTSAMREQVVQSLFECPPSWRTEIEHIAVRGTRLCLCRQIYRDTADADQPITIEALIVSEGGDDNRLQSIVLFDTDDIDAAFEELDERYRRGAASHYAHTWSVVNDAFTAINRHELPPLTADFTHVDNRRVATIATGDFIASIHAAWDQLQDFDSRIEAVHRLSGRGAVFTNVVCGTSQEGFDAEWREIVLALVDGDRLCRVEVFEENDVDLALSKFGELTPPRMRLENAATRARARMAEAFNSGRDLDACMAVMAADGEYSDRRRGLHDGGAARRGVLQAVFEAPKSWRQEITPIAVRGSRLALTHERFRDTDIADRPVTAETLTLTAVNLDGLVEYTAHFDPDDVNGAMAALTARWIASGEVGYPSTIIKAQNIIETYNRHDWDSMESTEAGAVYVNHRQLVSPEPETIVDHWRSYRALASLVPNLWVETAEILAHSASGGVTSVVVKGTTTEGAAIELPAITLAMFDGSRITRMEAFDLDQRDFALRRFDELNRQSRYLENTATRAWASVVDATNRRDFESFVAAGAADCRYDDRRKGLRDEGPLRPEAVRALFAAIEGMQLESAVVAIRGSHLTLTRDTYRDTQAPDQPITAEHLTLTEVDDDDLVRLSVRFDPDDLSAAMAELTSRWIASGEVAHPEVVRVMSELVETFNKHDWAALDARGTGASYISHRQLGTPGTTAEEFLQSTRVFAALAPDVRTEIPEILSHSAAGIVTHYVVRGRSAAGLDTEIPFLMLLLVDGDRITHIETFELDQRTEAVARLAELSESN